jgi:hypothetical protein
MPCYNYFADLLVLDPLFSTIYTIIDWTINYHTQQPLDWCKIMARTPKVVEDRHEQILDAAMHVFALLMILLSALTMRRETA